MPGDPVILLAAPCFFPSWWSRTHNCPRGEYAGIQGIKNPACGLKDPRGLLCRGLVCPRTHFVVVCPPKMGHRVLGGELNTRFWKVCTRGVNSIPPFCLERRFNTNRNPLITPVLSKDTTFGEKCPWNKILGKPKLFFSPALQVNRLCPLMKRGVPTFSGVNPKIPVWKVIPPSGSNVCPLGTRMKFPGVPGGQCQNCCFPQGPIIGEVTFWVAPGHPVKSPI